jgi:hypothetical protein
MAIQPTMPKDRFVKKFSNNPDETVALIPMQCRWMKYVNPETNNIQIFEPNRIRRIVVSKENIHLFLDGGVEFSMPPDYFKE